VQPLYSYFRNHPLNLKEDHGKHEGSTERRTQEGPAHCPQEGDAEGEAYDPAREQQAHSKEGFTRTIEAVKQ